MEPKEIKEIAVNRSVTFDLAAPSVKLVDIHKEDAQWISCSVVRIDEMVSGDIVRSCTDVASSTWLNRTDPGVTDYVKYAYAKNIIIKDASDQTQVVAPDAKFVMEAMLPNKDTTLDEKTTVPADSLKISFALTNWPIKTEVTGEHVFRFTVNWNASGMGEDATPTNTTVVTRSGVIAFSRVASVDGTSTTATLDSYPVDRTEGKFFISVPVAGTSAISYDPLITLRDYTAAGILTESSFPLYAWILIIVASVLVVIAICGAFFYRYVKNRSPTIANNAVGTNTGDTTITIKKNPNAQVNMKQAQKPVAVNTVRAPPTLRSHPNQIWSALDHIPSRPLNWSTIRV